MVQAAIGKCTITFCQFYRLEEHESSGFENPGEEDGEDEQRGDVADYEADGGVEATLQRPAVGELVAEQSFRSKPADEKAYQYRHYGEHDVGRHRVKEIKHP